jgi:hypothetical protein
MIRQGQRVNEAGLTKKAIEANKADADKAEDVDEAIVVVKAKADEANRWPMRPMWPIKPMRTMRPTKPLIVMRPKLMRPMRLISNNVKLFLLFLLVMAVPPLLIICSHSPSQNIPQSLRK